MASLCCASALHIAAQLRRRELGAVECLEYFRARVERLNAAVVGRRGGRARGRVTSLEVGSDIGGSIRNPAHYRGVFGHKPTFDIVPSDRLAPPPSVAGIDLAVAGPLARSAEDLDATLRLLVGPGRLNRAVRVELPESQRKLGSESFR